MNLLGGQLAAPAAEVDHDLEQVLLGLADGSYVLSTPDGAVAESGVGVAGLLGAHADALVGRPIADVLVAGADETTRARFEEVLRAPATDPDTRQPFPARCAGGATRSLQFVVVSVPLALGWEFTSLLTELRSRDATWHPEELRLRHSRALEAVEGVVVQGTQPDPGARLAGILIVVRDVDAPPLTHKDVERRMAEQRNAARAAAAEAARRLDEAAGRLSADAAIDDDEPASDPSGHAPGLEDLVERARVLRERVEDAERDAATATQERDEALARLTETEAERDAARAAAAGVQDAEGRSQHLADERDQARHRLEAAAHELHAARHEAETAHAAAVTAQTELAGARAEADAARADVEAARAELQSAHAEAQSARAEAQSAQADAERLRAELLATREAVHDERTAHSQSAGAELAALRAEAQAAHTEAEAVRAELTTARAELGVVRGDSALARGEASAVRAELQSTQQDLHGARAELEAARAELQARTNALHEREAELHAHTSQLLQRDAQTQAHAAELQERDEALQAAREYIDAHDVELADAVAQLESAQSALEAMRAELEDARAELQANAAELERARAELDATVSAAADIRAEREQARLRAQQLMNEAEQARAAAEAIRAEFAFDPIDDRAPQAPGGPPAQRTPWSVPPAATATATAAAEARPDLPAVGPGEAAALIALDGSFKRLDDAFCSLLGCREEDLRAARWPSIIDRENLRAHGEIARALRAGEIQSAEVETVYMHAQGLLVPIAGTVAAHRASPGGPVTHFLFRADVSRTAGVPGAR